MTMAKKRSPEKTNKPFLAVIAAVTGIALLFLLFFLPKQVFVGKAVSFGTATEEGFAGIFVAPGGGTANAGETIIVPVRANIGDQKSVSVGFSFTYDSAVLTPNCENIYDRLNARFTIPGNEGIDYDLTTRSEASCEEGIITFEYSGLCAPPVESCPNAITGDSLLAEIVFTANVASEGTLLEFETFDIFDLEVNPVGITFQDASLTIVGAPQEIETEAEEAAETAPAPSGGGVGGDRCIPRWTCDAWSFCGESLEQSRTCVDKVCKQSDRTETIACFPCQESWTCTPWSACSSGQQARSCVDEHACGTYSDRPALSKSCRQTVLATPAPVRVTPELPVPGAPTVAQPVKVPLFKDWRTYVGIVLALVVIGAVAFLAVYEVRKRKAAKLIG